MAIATRRGAVACTLGWRYRIRCASNKTLQGDPPMKLKWETPAARDLRFGFEITMYIANR